MANVELTILGCNSAKPTADRNPSGQVLQMANHYFLIDCGEGTQFQLRRMRINFMKIDYVFISHLHGDHVFGFIGLISTMALQNRSTPLVVFADPKFEELIRPHIDFFCNDIPFQLIFKPLNFQLPQIILSIKGLTVQSVPLKHRIPTCGFVFRENNRERNIKPTAICKYGLNFAEIAAIKNGKPYIDPVTGEKIPEHELLQSPKTPKSYAYISDTAYKPDIVPFIENVTLLYHEATFASEHADLAKVTFHSTAKEAATIAQKALVDRLLIGHYSSRYSDTDLLENEARQIFDNTTAVFDGFKLLF